MDAKEIAGLGRAQLIERIEELQRAVVKLEDSWLAQSIRISALQRVADAAFESPNRECGCSGKECMALNAALDELAALDGAS